MRFVKRFYAVKRIKSAQTGDNVFLKEQNAAIGKKLLFLRSVLWKIKN